MKKIFLLVLFLQFNYLVGQVTINMVKEVSYGNREHTNRDYLELSLKDDNDNIYLIGSTENDFTFNDIKIIKLSKDLAVLWETEQSFDLGISYDAVLGAHLDSFNNLIVICRAAYSSINQTFIVLKYSENGELLWQYSVSDLSNPIDHEYFSYYSFLDDTENLHLMYRPREQDIFEYFFIKISPEGQKIDEYSKTNQFIASDGLLNPYKILNYGEAFYMIVLDELDTEPWQKFTFHKFNKDLNESLELSLDNTAADYFKQSFAETWTELKKDKSDKLVLITPEYSLQKDYGILNLNLDGTINYSKYPDNTHDRYLLESGFDSQNNLVIISNTRLSGSNSGLQITMQKHDQAGNIIFEKSQTTIGIAVFLEESHISVLTSENTIVNYDYDFNAVAEIQMNTVDAYNFVPNSILNIGSNFYLSGMTEDPRYNGTIFLSDKDFLVKKANSTNELSSYTFSGKGTSKIFQLDKITVRDTAYAISVVEKLGPDKFGIGGSLAPVQKHFITYDKELNIVEDLEVGENDILETTNYPKSLNTIFVAENGDIYEYKINTDITQVSLLKNNNLNWTSNLNFQNNEALTDCTVSKTGDLLISTTINLEYGNIHRYKINNEFDKKTFSDDILNITPLSNKWLFVIEESGIVKILSDRLTLINENNSPIIHGVNQFYIKEKNNKIIFYAYNQQFVYIYNQYGEKETDYYRVKLDFNNNHIEYDNNYIIALEQIGASISLNGEYAWNRAVLKQFDLDISDDIGEVSFEDDDNDGTDNSLDECRNTPENEIANEFGCSDSQTLSTEQFNFANNLKVFPNPAKNLIYFTTTNSSNIKAVDFYNILGKKVINLKTNNFKNNMIDVSNLSSGVYLIKFVFENGYSISKKIILDSI